LVISSGQIHSILVANLEDPEAASVHLSSASVAVVVAAVEAGEGDEEAEEANGMTDIT
jgi:hypothetical protein